MPGLLLDQPQGQGLLQGNGLAGLLGMQPLAQRMVAQNQAWRKQANALGYAPAPPAAWSPEATELADIASNFDFTGAIKAYHGSPHTFDRFDMSKIGTGEGAQAYGHGLYFAQEPGVAKDYQKKLSLASDNQGATTTYQGKPITSFRELSKMPLEQVDPDQFLIHAAQGFGGIGKTAADRVKRSEQILNSWFPNASPEYRAQLAERSAAAKPDDFATTNGSLYTVNLDVNHDDLLDWDAPLSQQPEKVRKALEGEGFTKEALGPEYETLSGSQIYGRSKPFLGDPAEAAEALRAAGIPGIRYLDAGSRAGGEGSRNIVMFDDALAQILERNGQPVTKP